MSKSKNKIVVLLLERAESACSTVGSEQVCDYLCESHEVRSGPYIARELF
jgi:hypothetical protein